MTLGAATIMRLITTLALAAVLQTAVAGAGEQQTATMQKPTVTVFGKLPDGREAHLYTLEVPGGWKATVTDYGAILTGLHVPAGGGGAAEKTVDVVLGFDTLAGYLAGHPYFGAICGRVSNRIAAGSFELDGKKFQLAKNNGANHLHGGDVGFDKKLWRATPRLTDRGPAVELEMVSPAGDEGYPGALTTKVSYTLTPAGELDIDMTATTDAPTIVNLVHHSYWNLAGHAAGTIRGHELSVAADRYLPVDDGGIPMARIPAGSTIIFSCAAGTRTARCTRLRCCEIPRAAAAWHCCPISLASRSTPATTSTAR